MRKLREINVFWKWALKKGPKTRAGARFSPWGCKKAAKTPSFCGFWPRALIALAAPREPFAVFGRGRGKSGQKPRVFGIGLAKKAKNSALLAFCGALGQFFGQKRRVFGLFSEKSNGARVWARFLAKIGVWLGPGAFFCVLCVICGVFARLAEKKGVLPGFWGGQAEKLRKLRCFGAGFGAGRR